VTVDGKPVASAEPTWLYRFHKPPGLITAERDPAGRPTIYAALRNALPPGTPRLMPIGRLDFNTEGLLLLTNDGGFKREMELPATGVPRTYRARTFGRVSQAQLEDLMDGIEIDGVRYGPINANLERRTGQNQWVELALTEGKNREVRRVLEHLGLEVSRLIRTAYGPFALGDLAKGQAVEVRKEELERFRSGLRKSSPVHGEGGSREAADGGRPVRAPRPPKRSSPSEERRPKSPPSASGNGPGPGHVRRRRPTDKRSSPSPTPRGRGKT
jgi:23S rRNA pseudouridine2605 synthase